MTPDTSETKIVSIDAYKQFEVQQIEEALTRREIWFNRDVDEHVIEFLVMQIAELDRVEPAEDMNAAGVPVVQLPPITVYLNSYGGSLYDGLAGFDAMVAARSPIKTVALGKCISAGFIMFMAGGERLINHNSVLMMHTARMLDYGKLPDLKIDVEHVGRVMARAAEQFAARTNMTVEEWREIMGVDGHGKDMYFTPEETVDRGIAHRIIEAGRGL